MRRRSALIVAVPFLLTACFGVADKHSVLVKSVPANLAFGNPPADVTQRIAQLQFPGGFNFDNFPLFQFPPFVLPPGTPSGPCPTAGFGVFPADVADTDIAHKPTPGTYTVRDTFKAVINLPDATRPGQFTGVGQEVTVPVVPRRIHAFTKANDPTNPEAFNFIVDGAFAFQALDPKMSATFQSRPQSGDAVQQPSVPGFPPPIPDPNNPGQLPSPLPNPSPTAKPSPTPLTSPLPSPLPNPTPPQRPPNDHVGASPDGVFLTGLTTTINKVTFTFSVPAGGVQLLQATIGNGLRWSSSATDPAHGTSVSFSGGINPDADPTQTGSENVDACGELIQTWRVDGTLQLSGPSFAVRENIRMNFAPQYGGWIVADRHEWTNAVIGDASNPAVAAFSANMSGSTFDSTLNHLTPVP